MRSERLATLALLGITAIWGSTFIVVKDAVGRMPVLAFLAWRFAIAAVAMAVVRPQCLWRLSRAGRRIGVILGLAVGVGFVCQTFGLRTTPASVSGFITGMFVVFTPLLAGLLLHRPVGRAAWWGAGLATAGLAVISLRGLSIGTGELLTLVCAVAFAVHIVGLGTWSADHDAAGLAVLQLATAALMCTVAALPAGGLPLPPDAAVWWALAVTGLAATALAFFVQTWAQARLPPTRAAVVMTMEPVFAGVFAVVLGGERLAARTVVGGLLVLAAMALTELGPGRPAAAEPARLEI